MKRYTDHSTSTVNSANIRKKCITAILLTAILATMIVIFLLSSESPSESGNRSFVVTRQIARVLYPDFDNMSPAEQIRVVDGLHFTVRKGAHFTAYAWLGSLIITVIFVICKPLTRSKRQQLCLSGIAAAIGLVYAISDEVHQKFVHRGASSRDVCIDFAGVLFGIAVVWGISHIVWRTGGRSSADKGEGSI